MKRRKRSRLVKNGRQLQSEGCEDYSGVTVEQREGFPPTLITNQVPSKDPIPKASPKFPICKERHMDRSPFS